MQLQQYLRILWRRGWIMLLLAVLVAAAAFGMSLVIREYGPIYRATVKVQVRPARTDFGQAQAAKQLLGTYQAWLDSNYRARDVIETLQLDMNPAELRSDVRIASDVNTVVLQIEVENPDPDIANDVAWEWANLFVAWRFQENQLVRREDRIDAEILDDPIITLERPKTAINTAAGAIMGFLIGLIIVFALEYIESGVLRSPEDVDRFLGLPVLGAVPPSEG